MAVNIENVSLLALGNGWLVNGSAESLSLDGSIVHGARTLLASVTITGGSVKLLHHASDACLSQISFAGSVEATLKAQGELAVEVINFVNYKNFTFYKLQFKIRFKNFLEIIYRCNTN